MMYFVFQPWAAGATNDVYAVGWTVENEHGHSVENGLLAYDLQFLKKFGIDREYIDKNHGESIAPNLKGSDDPEALYEALCAKFWEAWVSAKMHGAEMFCWDPWPEASKFIWDCGVEYNNSPHWQSELPKTIHSVKSMWWAAKKWCDRDISLYVDGFPTQGNPHQQAKEIARSLFTCLEEV